MLCFPKGPHWHDISHNSLKSVSLYVNICFLKIKWAIRVDIQHVICWSTMWNLLVNVWNNLEAGQEDNRDKIKTNIEIRTMDVDRREPLKNSLSLIMVLPLYFHDLFYSTKALIHLCFCLNSREEKCKALFQVSL